MKLVVVSEPVTWNECKDRDRRRRVRRTWLWREDCFRRVFVVRGRWVRDCVVAGVEMSCYRNDGKVDQSRDWTTVDLLRPVGRHLQLLLR